MPDYKKLYYQLFRANEQALRALLQAQQAAEQTVLEEDEPPLRLGGSEGAGGESGK